MLLMKSIGRMLLSMIGLLAVPISGFTADESRPSGPIPVVTPELRTENQEILEAEPRRKKPDGMGGLGGMGGMGGIGGGGGPGYSAVWYPSRGVESGGSLGMVRQRINGGLPIWMDGPNTVLVTASLGNTMINTDARLPVSGLAIPNNLWNINLGLNYFRKFDNGWTGGAIFGFGSSSDLPFQSTREVALSFIGFLSMPARNDRDSWRFSLMYSPLGVLDFPIPGIAYLWNPSDKLSVSIGLPLSITWKPTDDWTLNMTYIPIATVNARSTYRVSDVVQCYGAFEWLNEGFFLAGRNDIRERFIGLEKRLVTGVMVQPFEQLTFDVSAGYAFDREIGLGQNQGISLQDSIQIKSGAFLGAALRLKF
jgi:hypothetical protein